MEGEWGSEIPLRANKKIEDESWSDRGDTKVRQAISTGAIGGCEETVPFKLIQSVLTVHCISAAQRQPESKLFEQNNSAWLLYVNHEKSYSVVQASDLELRPGRFTSIYNTSPPLSLPVLYSTERVK